MKRLQRVFKKAGVSAILIMNTQLTDPNFRYLTGFSGGIFEGSVLIAMPKKMVLLVSPLEYDVARREKPKEMQLALMDKREKVIAVLKKYMKNKVVGINGSFLPYRSYKRLKKLSAAKKFVDVTEAFQYARQAKDEREIALIRRANSITKRALKEIPKYFKEGMTEVELAKRFDILSAEYGSAGPSFPTIVCFGENSAVPHHVPTSAKLKPNSLVLIDCGAIYGSYCSDVTRTFVYKPDKKSDKYKRMMEMSNTVKEAQLLALMSVKPGTKGSVPHNIAADYINKAYGGRYKGKFIHSLGHSIGLEVHDPGMGFYPSEKGKLEENMVISDEPGIYVQGFGGVRIEDDVIITKEGSRFL